MVPMAAPLAQESHEVSVPPLQYTTRTLKNGLKVYALQDRTTPNVTVQMWYEVGSKHDPEGRSGFAHLFEHILSRKTRNMPLNMVNQLTEDVGGQRNASTGDDRTNYFEIVPAAYLETMLWTHAERMARPVVDAQVFETERGVVKEELRQRYLAPPYGRFGLIFPEHCYDTLPNRRPGIGNIEELDAASLEDARAFHEAYYGPDTATLIVSGNFDAAELDRLIDKYFASIARRKYPASLAIAAKPHERTAARAVTAYAPNVPLPAIASVWPLPKLTHPDAPALMVLEAILARGESSRLHRALVSGSETASFVQTFSELQEDGGCLATLSAVATGKTVEEAESAMRAEIVRLRGEAVSAEELGEAKIELLAQDLRQRETFAGRAFLLGEALVSTGDPAWPDKVLAAIQRVSADDVLRVARTYLGDTTRVDIRYLDESKRTAGESADAWRNAVPMPKFKPLPSAKGTANELAPEGQREAPPGPAADVPVVPPTIVEHVLPNGLKVIAAKTSGVPFASMILVADGGASTDPADKAGLAGLMLEVMTKGTGSRSADQIAAGIESLGATLDTISTQDASMLNVVAPLATIDRAAALLADVARNPSFPTDEFERERKRAIDGWSVAMKSINAIAGLTVQRAMYGTAPYGAPGTGTEVSLKRIAKDDLARAHEIWWRPDNMTLVVTGGIATDRAVALASNVFGDWKSAGRRRVAPALRAGKGEKVRTIVVNMPGAGQAAVVASVRAVKRSDPEFYALAAANAVLGAGSNGRLFQEVRVKRALSYGANSSLAARFDATLLTAASQTKNESAAEVAKVMLGELERLKNEPLTDAALDKRKTFLIGGFTRQIQTAGGLGGVIANFVAQGMPAREAIEFTAKLGRVNAEAASAAARRVIGADQATLVIVGDAPKFLEALKGVRGDVEVIAIDELDLERAALRKPQ
jgi:zinc protease